jgi:hypothetical protein
MDCWTQKKKNKKVSFADNPVSSIRYYIPDTTTTTTTNNMTPRHEQAMLLIHFLFSLCGWKTSSFIFKP